MTVPFATLRDAVARHWGYRTLRPLQEEAMRAELDGRDSLVVLPTGGGKSLCYQGPAVVREGLTVVVSPLIALMKDQVDGLRACGIAASQIDSTLSSVERYAVEHEVRQGEVNILFASPERLAMPEFCRFLQSAGVRSVAIDEAHCISHWGHDFRPEYRQLGRLKEFFPEASVHAYTATATEQVRRDICTQLNLDDPLVLVGDFDRPNLTYRVLARNNLRKQTLDLVKRRAGEAGIVYCMRRADVEELSEFLRDEKIRALPYHAGLDKDERSRIQDEFAEERCDVVVATVAFGMGIDRSNVRFVLHAALPKSIEHYQQETGRAGRDGLEAECVLLYSGGDVVTLRRMLERSAQEANASAEYLKASLKHLEEMDRYARGAVCRHRALVEHFGQKHASDNCGACDLCLGDNELVADALVVAQKILSCVARVQERFGINHVISVLRGEKAERVVSYGHDKLSTYGLLKDHAKTDVREWIYQLIGQGALAQTQDEYPVLRLTDASWEVMRKQRSVRLLQPAKRQAKEKPARSKADVASWDGVDRTLFESLRNLRLKLATERQVPPYVIVNDASLRELARVRPSTLPGLRAIHGIGDRKLQDFGLRLLDVILTHCRKNDVPTDVE